LLPGACAALDIGQGAQATQIGGFFPITPGKRRFWKLDPEVHNGRYSPLAPTCYHHAVENRTEPKTAGQWLRYVVVAVIALFLVWWMLRAYVL
jgi:hypothetical protein